MKAHKKTKKSVINVGEGARKKRTTKKTTKRGRPRKTKTGSALMPAGYYYYNYFLHNYNNEYIVQY